MTDDELYQRQEELDLQTPDKVAVIGVGGIGSWVALDIALAGAETIYLIDFDHIEDHNLNRTPYKQTQVDNNKVEALANLIWERRTDTEVIPLVNQVENLDNSILEEIQDATVIDCRDNTAEVPDQISIDITAGYDGFQGTIHFNPDFDTIIGDGSDGYETVPSFVGAPQMIASIITTTIFNGDLPDEEKIYTFDTRNAAEKLAN